MDIEPLDNADFSLVSIGLDGKPECKLHGAMNRVTRNPPYFWRCISTYDRTKDNACRAGCIEKLEGNK